MNLDFTGKTALITGGTKGLGLATAVALGGRGARTVLTYRWGSADETEVRRQFAEVGAPEPMIVQADVSRSEDTSALMDEIKLNHRAIDIFVSNATGGKPVYRIDELTERQLMKTIRYGTWPTLGYLFNIRECFGTYPRYVVAMSATGPDYFSVNYDLIAASRAALETLCRYMVCRLRDQSVHFNVVRPFGVLTDAFHQTFGPGFSDFLKKHAQESRLTNTDKIADVIVALCSGLLDGMNGQVLTVDRGAAFYDSTARLFIERERFGL